MNFIDEKISNHLKSWPFLEAKVLIERLKKNKKFDLINDDNPVLFETGYGPSGLPHIGTFGEVARTTMVQNAFYHLTGKATKLICFSDDMDGFRKVPENVPNQKMLSEHLEKPLTDVPDPFEKFESFGSYNNNKLKEFLDKFSFDYQFVSSTECYKSGQFNDALSKILLNYDKIKNVIMPTLGEERKKTYSPFLPICSYTGKVLQANVIDIDATNNSITYFSPINNKEEKVSILNGNCKLQWKCDWAMRWYALGVDYEMAGKDLSESVILSAKILNILGGSQPAGFSYELFLDGNGQKISKSKGNGLSIEEWLAYGTEESLSLFMFNNPKRAKKLFFDVIPKTIDEYYSFLSKYNSNSECEYDNPVWHIHKSNPPKDIFPVSFNLLLNLSSVCNADNSNDLWSYITNYTPELKKGLNKKFDMLVDLSINYYKQRVLPFKKFRLPSEFETKTIKNLVTYLKDLDAKTSNEEIQSIVFKVGKEAGYENLREWFSCLYETALGQSSGPRMGGFIKLYGINKSIKLLEDVLNGSLVK